MAPSSSAASNEEVLQSDLGKASPRLGVISPDPSLMSATQCKNFLNVTFRMRRRTNTINKYLEALQEGSVWTGAPWVQKLYKDADANRPGDGLIALEIATYKADNAFMNAEASFRNCYAFLMSNLSGLTTAEQRSLENEVTALSVAISEAEDLDESGAVTESGAPSSAPPGPDCPDEKNANCRCDIAKRKPLPAHCRGFMPWHH